MSTNFSVLFQPIFWNSLFTIFALKYINLIFFYIGLLVKPISMLQSNEI